MRDRAVVLAVAIVLAPLSAQSADLVSGLGARLLDRRGGLFDCSVPFGQLETRPWVSLEDQEALLRANRARYASGAEALVVDEVRSVAGLGQPELCRGCLM